MTPELAYFAFGATLCALLAAIAVLNYRRSQKERVESPKYRMLEDEEER